MGKPRVQGHSLHVFCPGRSTAQVPFLQFLWRLRSRADFVARLLVDLGFCRIRFWYPVALGSGISRETGRIYFWNLITTLTVATSCDFQKCLQLTRSCATTIVGQEVLHVLGSFCPQSTGSGCDHFSEPRLLIIYRSGVIERLGDLARIENPFLATCPFVRYRFQRYLLLNRPLRVHLNFEPSRIGSVSRSVSDFTICCVCSLYFLKWGDCRCA